METNWAAENLQVIRTLMERSALYRRALAPVMIGTGSVGLGAGVLANFLPVEGNRNFSLYWILVSFVALVTAFLLVRRQALRESEPFWSPPTRRVTQALAPAFLAGLCLDLLVIAEGGHLPDIAWLLASAWLILYGCALHAAGFFMQRGIRLLGFFLILAGCLWLALGGADLRLRTTQCAHWAMAGLFGGVHLAYGAYLYVTERRRDAS